MLRCVAEARVLAAIATEAAPPRCAYLVRGPDFWRELGVSLVARGMPTRMGVHRVQARMFSGAAREGRWAIEPVLCGLCGRPGAGDLQSWAAAHPLSYVGTSRRHV